MTPSLILMRTLYPTNSQEIQRRCESIVKMVEKEIADVRQAEEEEEKKKAADAQSSLVAQIALAASIAEAQNQG